MLGMPLQAALLQPGQTMTEMVGDRLGCQNAIEIKLEGLLLLAAESSDWPIEEVGFTKDELALVFAVRAAPMLYRDI